MKPILFVHIPKTAGTSLNASAAKLFGTATVERDYGIDAPHTSDAVRRFIYESETVDQYGFLDATHKAGTRWITGHSPADRFLHLFGATNTISFVRDPVERVISEYRHLVRVGKMEQSLEEFYKSEAETNKQFNMIGMPPWRAYHLVGSQDSYERCVALLATELGVALEVLSENVRPASDNAPVGEEIRQAIRDHNELDCRFVTQVRAYLDQHFAAHDAGKAFCYHEYGLIPDTHIIGWCFYRESNAAVQLNLLVDGVVRETVQASEHRAELQTIGVPRLGHCGFRFVLSDYDGAERVEVRTVETGQTICDWQRETGS